MLPDRIACLLTLRGCCQSIGLDWNTPFEMEQYSVKTLVQVLKEASPTSWSDASLEMFVGLIQLRFLQNKCYIRKFDEDWFTSNNSKTLFDLSVYLTENAVDLE